MPAVPRPGRMGRRWGQGLAAAVLLGATLLGGTLYADRRWPLDLARSAARSVVVLDAAGETLRAFPTPEGRWRLGARPALVDARYVALLEAYEDRRFARHPGIDPLAVLRAAGQWLVHGHIVSGASTLTMQTARLIEPRPRSLWAKLAQMGRALQLERRFSKDEILGLYLTLAPFGGNLEGVRAASLAYFGKEPRHLTLGEAALLVALPQSPERQRPDRHPEAARRGRDKVLARLRDEGVIGAGEAAEAMAEPLPTRRQGFPWHAPHLAARLARAAAGGAAVATTIDGDVQRALEGLAHQEAARFDDGGDLAVAVVENRGHRLLAYLGSADFFARSGQLDLGRAQRSPGSALKPFIYALAFDDRLVHPATLIDDAPMRFGDYAPRDFDREFQGTVTVREALSQSLNIPAVALLDRVGPVRFVGELRQAGARLSFRRLAGLPSLPVALGGVGISLVDLTMLYADLADGGRELPLAVTPAAAATGLAPAPRRLMSEAAAWYVTDILAGSPLPEGWAAAQGLVRPRRIAFKTGTSYGFRDAWAMGYSPAYTVGVWVGRADGSPRPGHYGRNTAAPVLLKIFDLLPGEAPRWRPPPADILTAASSGELPPGLRHFEHDRDAGPSPARAPHPPHILFPPDGAVVEWRGDAGIERSADAPPGIALKAEGGKPPLRWIVNGTPLAPPPFVGAVPGGGFWRPDGTGYARIAVVDAEGQSAAVRIRIAPAE